MAKKSLTTDDMLVISDRWLTPPKLGEPTQQTTPNEVLHHLPETVGLMPHLKEAHQNLKKARPQSAKEVEALAEQSKSLDVTFDAVAQATIAAYEILAVLSKDPAEAAELRRLSALHFPIGADVTKLQRWTEGGAMIATEETLDLPSQVFLSEQKLGTQGTLLDALEECISLGRELQTVEQLRVDEENKAEAEKATTISMAQARSGWIAAVDALIVNLGFATIDQQTRKLILGPLEEFEAEAEKRRATATRRKQTKKEKAQGASRPVDKEPELTDDLPEETDEK